MNRFGGARMPGPPQMRGGRYNNSGLSRGGSGRSGVYGGASPYAGSLGAQGASEGYGEQQFSVPQTYTKIPNMTGQQSTFSQHLHKQQQNPQMQGYIQQIQQRIQQLQQQLAQAQQQASQAPAYAGGSSTLGQQSRRAGQRVRGASPSEFRGNPDRIAGVRSRRGGTFNSYIQNLR